MMGTEGKHGASGEERDERAPCAEAILESIPGAVYTVDAEWRLTYINPRTKELWGRPGEKLLGTVLWDLLPDYRETENYRQHHLAMCERKPVRFQAFSPHHRFWADVDIAPMADGGLLVHFRDITDHKELELLRRGSHDDLEIRVRERTADLRSMTRRLMSAQEDERGCIARGLHDEVGQLLAACQMKLVGLGDLLPEDRKAEIAEIEELLATSGSLIRDLIFELATPTLERAGFAAAARELCRNMEEREGLAITWEERARNHAVPKDAAACLYHSLRQLLCNIAHHAEAEEATVYFECDHDALRLAVGDDGKGFDAEALSTGLTRTNGFGLHDVRARVDALDGEVNIVSTPGEGARVEIRLPLARPGEEREEKTE